MRRLLLFGFSLLVVTTKAQEAWTNKNRILPDRLRGIPTALRLTHDPNPNYPERNPEPNGPTYLWDHTTCITPLHADLEIVEVGSFIWSATKGWIPNMKLNKKAFKRRFRTDSTQLVQNETYCYPKNLRSGNTLFAGDALWFVLAKDKQGQLFKGIGIIETEGKLKK
ncbi:MAG: hypothetical protein AAGF77_07325 [Bacteroidota bacterium]